MCDITRHVSFPKVFNVNYCSLKIAMHEYVKCHIIYMQYTPAHTHKKPDEWWFVLQFFFQSCLLSLFFPPDVWPQAGTSSDLLDWQSSGWCKFWIAKLKGIFSLLLLDSAKLSRLLRSELLKSDLQSCFILTNLSHVLNYKCLQRKISIDI